MKATKLSAPPGDLWVIGDEDRIVRIVFQNPDGIEKGETPLLLNAREQLLAYLLRGSKTFDLPLEPRGTHYQLRVWQVLEQIRYGNTISYSELAGMVGGATVARAVGTACGANPLPILIPCHRVVAVNGSLTGYLGGLEWKRWLLTLEGAEVMADGNLFAQEL